MFSYLQKNFDAASNHMPDVDYVNLFSNRRLH